MGHPLAARDGLQRFAAESRRAKLRTTPTTNSHHRYARPNARHGELGIVCRWAPVRKMAAGKHVEKSAH